MTALIDKGGHYLIGLAAIAAVSALAAVGVVTGTVAVGVIIAVASALVGGGIAVAGAKSAPTTLVTTTTTQPAQTQVAGPSVRAPRPPGL